MQTPGTGHRCAPYGCFDVALTRVQKLCRVVNNGQNVEDVFELNLSSDEDAPMTLALDRGVGHGMLV